MWWCHEVLETPQTYTQPETQVCCVGVLWTQHQNKQKARARGKALLQGNMRFSHDELVSRR